MTSPDDPNVTPGSFAPGLRPVTYVLPIRATAPPDDELVGYLRRVSGWCPVIVVDGSGPEVFAAAHEAFGDTVLHLRAAPEHRGANGKVGGVLTGLDHARTSAVVIADDDVRYDEADLVAVVAALGGAAVVVPQNYFAPVPWHAGWDTARTLLNRMTGGDFPGTLAVDARVLRATGGYDGDVLFENLELIRTVEAAGGISRRRSDIAVRRLPPTTRHFLGQRVRQAYDEFARPGRLVAALTVAPVVALLLARGRTATLVTAAAALVFVAEGGRRRWGGGAYFPWWTSLLAPVWVAERAVCTWIAVAARPTGGVCYAGARLVTAATPSRRLRQRHAGARRAIASMTGSGSQPAVTAATTSSKTASA